MEKKGVEQSFKSNAVDEIIDKINEELSKPHKVVDIPNIVNGYIEQLNQVLRHLQYKISCNYNGLYEGYIFIAWLENNQLFTRIIKL